jgi:hypothetical protein
MTSIVSAIDSAFKLRVGENGHVEHGWSKNIEEKILQLQIANERDYKVIVFFDLDIFEPSLVGWQNVKHSLKNGDILYFDEAFDKDERKLLDEFVLPSGEFEFVGCSWLTLSLRVKQIYS